MEPLTLLSIAVFLTVWALTTTQILNKNLAAIAGATLISAAILFFMTGAENHGWPLDGIDWKAVMVLPALAVFAQTLQRSGLAQFLAIKIIKLVQASPVGVLILTAASTFVLAFLVGTPAAIALFLPVTFLITAEMGIPVVPFLLAQAVAAANGGLFSAVGGLAQLLVTSGLGISYPTYFATIFPYGLAALAGAVLIFLVSLGHRFNLKNERKARILDFDATKSLRDPALVVKAGIIVLIVTGVFFLGNWWPIGLVVPAWLGAAALLLVSRDSKPLVQESVENGFPVFLVGVLVLVEGLTQTGWSARWGGDLVRWTSTATGPWLLLGVSGILSSFVDNLPWVAGAVPVLRSAIHGLSAGVTDPGAVRLWVPIVVGSALGSTTTLWSTGNSLTQNTARKSGVPLKSWDFARVGLAVLVVQLVAVGLMLTFLIPAR